MANSSGKCDSAVAKTVEEICKLAEDGMDVLAEIQGTKLSRKPN